MPVFRQCTHKLKIYTCIYTSSQTYMHANIHTCLQTQTHTDTHTHIHIPRHIFAYKHTHTHTYMYVNMCTLQWLHELPDVIMAIFLPNMIFLFFLWSCAPCGYSLAQLLEALCGNLIRWWTSSGNGGKIANLIEYDCIYSCCEMFSKWDMTRCALNVFPSCGAYEIDTHLYILYVCVCVCVCVCAYLWNHTYLEKNYIVRIFEVLCIPYQFNDTLYYNNTH